MSSLKPLQRQQHDIMSWARRSSCITATRLKPILAMHDCLLNKENYGVLLDLLHRFHPMYVSDEFSHLGGAMPNTLQYFVYADGSMIEIYMGGSGEHGNATIRNHQNYIPNDYVVAGLWHALHERGMIMSTAPTNRIKHDENTII